MEKQRKKQPKVFLFWHTFLAFSHTSFLFFASSCVPSDVWPSRRSASSSRRSTHQSTLTHPYTLPQVDEGIKDKAWHGMEWVDAASEVKEGYRGSLEANHSQQPAGHIPNPSIELSMEQVKHVHKYRSI